MLSIFQSIFLCSRRADGQILLCWCLSRERTDSPWDVDPVNGPLNAPWLESSPGYPWFSPSLWGATADTRIPLHPSVITLTLNSTWPSPLLWKASWPRALRRLHTHLKETEPASLFLNAPQWEVSSFSTYKVSALTPRGGRARWEGMDEARVERSGNLDIWWMPL